MVCFNAQSRIVKIDGLNLVDGEPDVVPLQYLGSAESKLSAASTQDVLMHALTNLTKEGGYAV